MVHPNHPNTQMGHAFFKLGDTKSCLSFWCPFKNLPNEQEPYKKTANCLRSLWALLPAHNPHLLSCPQHQNHRGPDGHCHSTCRPPGLPLENVSDTRPHLEGRTSKLAPSGMASLSVASEPMTVLQRSGRCKAHEFDSWAVEQPWPKGLEDVLALCVHMPSCRAGPKWQTGSAQ